MFKVYAVAPEDMSPSNIAVFAQRVEAMSYDGLQIADAIHDGFLLAALALNATSHLKVCIGVLVIFPRSPMNVAISAWDLQRLSGGRFELGLGTQVEGNIEKRYSTPWTPPLKRMREYIEALRAIFDAFQYGEKLNYVGANYQFTRLQPFFNPGPIEHPHIPLLIGAVGPKMTNLAGAIADGMLTHPTNTPPRYIREVILPRLKEGGVSDSSSRGGFQLMLGSFMATGVDDKGIAAERLKYKNLLAFLFSTPAYWPSLELFGWQDIGEQLLTCTRENRWQDMNALVSEEMLDAFLPTAHYGDIGELLTKWYQGLAGVLTFPVPTDPSNDSVAALVIESLKAGC
jgi:probable F420-dependent oxidoreductase